jgi:KaiC/GvpD/RAD55 family RecA-like ATPase
MVKTVKLSTGSPELDRQLDGGLNEGYVVNLRGEPGSGKTLFATQVARKNAVLGKKTLYVSFLEDRDKFVSGVSSLLPDIEAQLQSGQIAYVELSSVVRGGVEPIIDMIFKRINDEKPQILVFDSYSALLQAMGSEADGRSVLSNLFSRLLSKRKITSLIITEGDHNDFVSYVADGIIRMGRRVDQGETYRKLELLKMRGAHLEKNSFLYVFQKGSGIRLFSPATPQLSDKIKPRKVIPDRHHYYSTGSRSLDLVIGGYQKGSLVLWEMGENIPQLVQYSVPLLVAANFLAQGRALMVLPSLEFTAESLKPFLYPDKDTFERSARVFLDDVQIPSSMEKYIVHIHGDMEKDLESWNEVYSDFKRRGQTVLKVVSLDLLEHLYGKEHAVTILRRAYMLTSLHGDLTLLVAKPGLELVKEVKYMASSRLSLKFTEGYVIFRSTVPYSGAYLYEPRFTRGYPEAHLYQIN